MDVDELQKEMDEWVESPEGNAYFENMKIKRSIQESRYMLFEKWLETNDFDKLMYRLILEHNDDYISKCYHNGYEPYPNRKLNFIIEYVTKNIKPNTTIVKELECDFSNAVWEFKGYYFQYIHGQGTIFRLYNKDDLRLLLQL